ncbi:Homoserine kinase [Labilithrix luteola]|uniref:Homoserine kinase n=1 Tax=Labilithrix luteola TaxID=1391654 RepID=A0A0K1Q6K5_9BACT|nr:homoserine kinase [Labilithrix luteola]AKV01045.1 Homoserine kinase [Labilithrix luteola]
MAIRTIPADADLQSFLSAYGRGSPSNVRGLEAGTVNTSYAVNLGDDRYFLRIYEEQGHDGAEREAALLFHLASNGVPTPAPIATPDGTLVRTLAGKPAALFPWVDGDMLCQRAVTPEAARITGASLAMVHRVGPPPSAAPNEGRFGPKDLVVRCSRIASSSDPEARVLGDSLSEAVSSVAKRRDPLLPSGLVHGDLFRDNVLWQQSRIAALLDFESAHHGPFAYDLAVTILSWSFADALVPDIARAIVEGYREEREITPPERDALYDEAILATLRFTITRITDDAIRVGKRWQRFVERREAIERLGRSGFREVLGL